MAPPFVPAGIHAMDPFQTNQRTALQNPDVRPERSGHSATTCHDGARRYTTFLDHGQPSGGWQEPIVAPAVFEIVADSFDQSCLAMAKTMCNAIVVAALLWGFSGTAAAHGHWHGHGGGSHFGFYFGAPLFWDPYPYYYYRPRPVVIDPPPVYIQQVPPVYVQQPSRGYWYYCPNPAGYYPTVPRCPAGWMPVPAQ